MSSLLNLVREKAPFFVLAALSSAVTIFAQQSGGALTPVDKLAFGARITNALVSYASYIGKMIWPFHLAVVYPHPGKGVIWQAAGAAFILVCISILVIRAARRHAYLAVGWLWYLGTLVPVIGLVQVGKQAMADRYTYVPLIGLFMIIAWGAADLTARWRSYRAGLATSAGVLVIALATCTWFQVGYWQNGVVLFEHALHVTSKNYLAHNNLGVALARQGRFDEAAVHLSNALEIRPKYAWAHNNLGAVLARQGNLNEAVDHFSEALRIDPKLAEADMSMGIALASQGHLQEAIDHFSKALEIRPDSIEVRNNLGVTLARLGRFDEAAAHFSKVLEIMPGNAEVRDNLRRASKEARRQREASSATRGR
jgi:Flp pilus assembly protein TadD